MKKKYIVPSLQIEKFQVEDILTESATEVPNVLTAGITDEEGNAINFSDGNTLEAIDYRKFLQ